MWISNVDSHILTRIQWVAGLYFWQQFPLTCYLIGWLYNTKARQSKWTETFFKIYKIIIIIFTLISYWQNTCSLLTLFMLLIWVYKKIGRSRMNEQLQLHQELITCDTLWNPISSAFLWTNSHPKEIVINEVLCFLCYWKCGHHNNLDFPKHEGYGIRDIIQFICYHTRCEQKLQIVLQENKVSLLLKYKEYTKGLMDRFGRHVFDASLFSHSKNIGMRFDKSFRQWLFELFSVHPIKTMLKNNSSTMVTTFNGSHRGMKSSTLLRSNIGSTM